MGFKIFFVIPLLLMSSVSFGETCQDAVIRFAWQVNHDRHLVPGIKNNVKLSCPQTDVPAQNCDEALNKLSKGVLDYQVTRDQETLLQWLGIDQSGEKRIHKKISSALDLVDSLTKNAINTCSSPGSTI